MKRPWHLATDPRLNAAKKGGLPPALQVTLILLLTMVAACAPAGSSPNSSSTTGPFEDNSQIAVDAGKPRVTLPPTAFGMNTAVWDKNLLDPAVPGLLRQGGVTMLRFPGGSIADIYHWQDNSLTQGMQGYVSPNNTFDAFMKVTQQAKAQAFITVNYGTNKAGTDGEDPAEAAAWVQYANRTKQYGIKYWEIGNEVFGNGTYGSQWEADRHADKSPTAYANNVLQFVRAMKAVDPSIKIGITLPAPDLTEGTKKMADWDPTVLSIVGSQIDFIDVHWYPQWHDTSGNEGPDDQLLASTINVPTMLARFRSEIAQYSGANAKNIEILLGEVNTKVATKQRVSLVNALFLADVYMSWLGNGGTSVIWWELHEGLEIADSRSANAYGSTNYGTMGILSDGDCKQGTCEPPPNTPFPPYYGLQMLTYLGRPGDQVVSANSKLALVSVYAVKQTNGNLAVLLINKDPSTTVTPTLALSGYTPAATATTYFYGMNSNAISSNSVKVAGTTLQTTLPPYSLTTIVFSRK